MKAIIGVIAVLGIALAGAVLSGAPQVAKAATISFAVQASGANEVPAVTSGGAASGQFSFDDETNELTYVVAVRGINQDQVTAAHIHRGAAGEAGPVAYTLSEVGFLQVAGTVMLSDEDADLLMAGGLYLNVHSIDHPDGFARGQLAPPEATTSDDTDETDGTPEATPEAGATEEVEASTDIAPPSTGDAGLAAGGGTDLWTVVVLVAMLGLGSGAWLIRSRA
jgi:hypothetical protein